MSRIAILVGPMFEDAEFRIPFDRLLAAGHEVEIVGLEEGAELVGKHGRERIGVDKAVLDVSAEDYDALVIPGGYSPDYLRTDPEAVRFTRAMALEHKPIAAVCHGPWMLIEADVADGRVLTSWPSLKTDLINAGARWVDREVVVDGNIITSRKPADLPAFTDELLHQLEYGAPERAEPVLPLEAIVEGPTMH